MAIPETEARSGRDGSRLLKYLPRARCPAACSPRVARGFRGAHDRRTLGAHPAGVPPRFFRISDNSLAGMTPMADKLDADVATLKSKVATNTYQPAELANGASDLLTEVSTTKVTGEEDRYSHTDLWDFAANIAGAREAFDLLEPALAVKDPDLAQQLDARFTDVTARLAKYSNRDGYVDYSTVAEPDRRALADAVNALAEPLSQVAGKVV